VFRKIKGDLEAAKVSRSDHFIHEKMEELLAVAAEQVMNEKK